MGLLGTGERPVSLEFASAAGQFAAQTLRSKVTNHEPLYEVLTVPYSTKTGVQTDILVRFQGGKDTFDSEGILRELEDLHESVCENLPSLMICQAQRPSLDTSSGSITYGCIQLPDNTRVILLPSNESLNPNIFKFSQRPGSRGYRRMIQGVSEKGLEKVLSGNHSPFVFADMSNAASQTARRMADNAMEDDDL